MTDHLLLSPEDIAGLEVQVVETFDRYCTVMRESREPDGMGGQTRTWVEVAWNVRCRITATQLDYAELQGRIATIASTRVVVPKGTDVEMGDKLVLDDATVWRVEVMPLEQPVTKVLRVGLWRA